PGRGGGDDRDLECADHYPPLAGVLGAGRAAVDGPLAPGRPSMIQYYRRFIAPERYLSRWLDPRLGTLRVADVQAYLERRGGNQGARDGPHTLVFQEPPGGEGERLYQFVPDSEADPDYLRRMVELITLLAFFEDRHPVQIIDDILHQGGRDGGNGASQEEGRDRQTEAVRK